MNLLHNLLLFPSHFKGVRELLHQFLPTAKIRPQSICASFLSVISSSFCLICCFKLYPKYRKTFWTKVEQNFHFSGIPLPFGWDVDSKVIAIFAKMFSTHLNEVLVAADLFRYNTRGIHIFLRLLLDFFFIPYENWCKMGVGTLFLKIQFKQFKDKVWGYVSCMLPLTLQIT